MTEQDDAIAVAELPDGIFGNVLDAYSHRAFDRGYQVAVTELMASILPAVEQFLRQRAAQGADAGPEVVRETLYQFERFLARKFDATTRADGWLEGGAGI